MTERIFALDIGTQSVTGILLEKQHNHFTIIDYYVKHHKERSMLDGQIQHIVEVASVITEVKQALESKHGQLNEVCVAAAGRALKTIQTNTSISLIHKPITTVEEIKHLELSAVQQAQAQLVKHHQDSFTQYHCVGYSVLHYYVDGEKMASLIDQNGQEATVEIIATFLPKIVIESLLVALDRAELKMKALTLEPIAAIHILIPASMRRLNVALIDIGAGTSDIAISNDGTVIAYGMVPVAGDEITEAISDSYLLDFKVAEDIKQQIVNKKKAIVHDILGFESEITYEQLVYETTETVEQLAALLGEEILKLNGSPPQAVMLIGGGSLTPAIGEKLAHYLQLPKNRVALRDMEAIQYLDAENKQKLPKGPEYITPIGIAISATENPIQYTTVYVNEKMTLMFKMKELTVGDCLIQAGIDINKYYGKIGLAAIVTVNETRKTLRGEYGEPPTIYVNGQAASVHTIIDSDDKITINKGKDGKDPHITVGELAEVTKEITFYFQNEKHTLSPSFNVNNEKTTRHQLVQDNDNIQIYVPKTVRDFLAVKRTPFKEQKSPFNVLVNNRNILVEVENEQLQINGIPADFSQQIRENDDVSLYSPEEITVATLLQQLHKPSAHTIQVTFNQEPVQLTQQQIELYRDNVKLDITTALHPNDSLSLTELPLRPFIFQDVFRYVEIEIQNKKGYQLYKNDSEVYFHEEINHGDQLEIIWT